MMKELKQDNQILELPDTPVVLDVFVKEVEIDSNFSRSSLC